MHLKKSSSTLTKREMEIMTILWESEEPIVASEIARRGDNLTVNTVQSLLKKLMKLGYIKVADIVYSGTVLSRCYTPVISADDYEMNNMMNAYNKISDKPKGMSALFWTMTRILSSFYQKSMNCKRYSKKRKLN